MNYSFSSLTRYFSGKNNFHPDSSPNSGLEIAIADGMLPGKHPNHVSNLLRGIKGYVAKVGVPLVLAAYVMASPACGGQAIEQHSIPTPPTSAAPATLESTVKNTSTPTPENRRIYGIDVHHGKLHDEGDVLKTIENYVSGKGWKIKKINVEPLTSKYLQQEGISILHIQNVTLPYTENEIAEIKKFVEQGGGLFLVATKFFCNEYSKEIAREFGVRILDDYVGRVDGQLTITVSSNHPLMKGVNSFNFHSDTYRYCDNRWVPSSYLNVNPPAFSVLEGGETEPYKPVIAAAEVGKGRVIISPSTLFSFYVFNHADNSTFFRNAIYWLQQEKLP